MGLQAFWDLFLTGCMRGSHYALMAVGLSLVFGVMNIPQFAHGEFFMLGAYAAYFAFTVGGASPLLAISVGGLAGLIGGILVEKTIFYHLRRRAKQQWVLNSFLVTVGLSFLMQNGAQAVMGGNYYGITRYWQSSVRLGSSMAIPMDRVMSCVVAAFSILSLWLFLHRTNTGRAIRAVAQDETGAMLMGIDLDRIHTLTFGLSALLAAVAGATLLSMIPAYPSMGLEPLYKSWYVVILGGLGNIGGAVPAGLFVGLFETFGYYFFGSGWQSIVSLALIILILIFKPNGLFGRQVKGIWER